MTHRLTILNDRHLSSNTFILKYVCRPQLSYLYYFMNEHLLRCVKAKIIYLYRSQGLQITAFTFHNPYETVKTLSNIIAFCVFSRPAVLQLLSVHS